jgi:hypothetical protein
MKRLHDMDQTEGSTTHLDGMIVNRCIYCMTYCVISIPDVRHALAEDNNPKIKCHHCYKLFPTAPDLEIKPKIGSTFVTLTNLVKSNGAKKLASSKHLILTYLLVIACILGLLYWAATFYALSMQNILNIL